MTWLARLSLRQKLMLISVSPTVVALLLMLVSNLFLDRQAYRKILENELDSTARMLAFNSTALLEFGEKLAGIKLLEATSIYPDIDYACIFDRNGERFSEYLRADSSFVDKPQSPRDRGIFFETSAVHLYHPIMLGDERLGTIYLHSTMAQHNEQLRKTSTYIVLLLFLSALVGLVFAFRVQRLIYNPVIQLAGAARTITRTNDYSLRVIKQSDDELGDLVDQFNRMLRRIQTQNTALKSEIIVREGTEQQLTAANEELQFEIGQRVQAEGQLGVLLDDLEKKNAELQDFAYVVSHDLKAPLRGISSLATWLIKDYGDVMDDKGIKYLNQLKDRTRRMHTFIEGILQYSRLGRAPMNKELLDTQQLVQQVIETLNPPETVSVLIPEPLPMVYYDKLFLIQVFQNLIGNALQHMGTPDGTITIGYTELEASWEFFVEDTGVGIESQHHERIFRIFQSLQKRETGDSSGIGLTLVKKIIERNGGEIRVESTLGEGTTFLFTVPIRAERGLPSTSLTIFILDANEDYARHTTRLLRNLGHKVRAETSWQKGKQLLAQGNVIPDVILIDHTSLKNNVEETLAELHRTYPVAQIIACIPKSSDQKNSVDNTMPFAGLIIKPFTLDKMNAILVDTPNTDV